MPSPMPLPPPGCRRGDTASMKGGSPWTKRGPADCLTEPWPEAAFPCRNHAPFETELGLTARRPPCSISTNPARLVAKERGLAGPGGGYIIADGHGSGLLDKEVFASCPFKHPGRQKGGREAPRQQSLPGAAAGGPLWPGVPDTETRCHKGKSFGEKSFCCGKRKARQIKTAAATRQEAGQILISWQLNKFKCKMYKNVILKML